MYEIDTKEILEAQRGSQEALTKIVTKNSGLVWSIVNRFSNRGYSKEELYQIGCVGLIKSIKRFDIKYDVRFSTYAVPYILGEIKRFLRDDTPIKISRKVKEIHIKIREIQDEYLKQNGKEISIKEISDKLDIPREEIAAAIQALKPVESIDEEAYKDNSNGESRISKINKNQDETNELINRLTIQKLINDLDNRNRDIIILRYFENKTQQEVAKILGVSQVQVSRIEKKILLSMREKMVG